LSHRLQIVAGSLWICPLSTANFETIKPPSANIHNHVALGPTSVIIGFARVVVFGKPYDERQIMDGSGCTDWNNRDDLAAMREPGGKHNYRSWLDHFRRDKAGKITHQYLSGAGIKTDRHSSGSSFPRAPWRSGGGWLRGGWAGRPAGAANCRGPQVVSVQYANERKQPRLEDALFYFSYQLLTLP